jgi:hypothetical protein
MRILTSSRSIGALMVGAAFLASCGTMVNGTTQRLKVVSEPPGAQVKVDSVPVGETPTSIELKRKVSHVVRIEKAGYLSYEETVSQSTSGWIAGDIILGGLIGLAVDAMSGGMYNLTPEEISPTLLKSPSSAPVAAGSDTVTAAQPVAPVGTALPTVTSITK